VQESCCQSEGDTADQREEHRRAREAERFKRADIGAGEMMDRGNCVYKYMF